MNTTTNPLLKVWCLSDSGLSVDNGPRKRPRPKVMELLVLLMLARGDSWTRADLAACLWPTADPSNALDSLRQHLTRMRVEIRPQEWRLQSEGKNVRFEIAGVEVDAFAFRDAMRQAKQTGDLHDFEEALERYSGPLLASSEVSRIERERKQLHELYLNGLEQSAIGLLEQGERERAVLLLLRGLEIAPLSERLVGLTLRQVGHDLAVTDRVFAAYRQAAERTPGHRVSETLQAQYDQARLAYHRNRHSKLGASSGADGPSRPRLDRIPAALHELVGRVAELERIRTCLDETRLVTLIGVGGVGKTRLGLEAAATHGPFYRDGVVCVDLAGLPPGASQDRIARMIATSLEIGAEDTGFVDRIIAFLTDRQMLLVLDNCEHLVLFITGLIRSLLQRCPRLTLLLTSRVELLSDCAAMLEIKPLRVPEGDPPTTVVELRQSPAVRLFERLYGLRHPEFRLTPDNAAQVARICRATDGLPLAIQLVASEGSLTLTELDEALAKGLSALERPDDLDDASQPARSTVFKSIAWSYQLLTLSEQELLRDLSLFAGGWTREAVDAIFENIEPGQPKPSRILDRLCAKSLVERQEVGERSRFRMLETIREYATSLLQGTPTQAEITQRHLDYYLQRAEQLASGKEGQPSFDSLENLMWEQENARIAMAYSLATGQIEKALRLATALAHGCFFKGRMHEGREWSERLLAIADNSPARLRRDALYRVANLAYQRNDYEQAEKLWSICLRLCRELDAEDAALVTQGNLGLVALTREDFDRAGEIFDACLIRFREKNDDRGIASTLANLALVAKRQGDYERALLLHRESIEQFRSLGMLHDAVVAWNNLTALLLLLERYPEAHEALVQAIDLSLELNNPHTLAYTLLNAVMLAVDEGQTERAAILIGAQESLAARSGASLPIGSQLKYQPARLKIATELGEEKFTVLWNAGANIELPEICRYTKARRSSLPV